MKFKKLELDSFVFMFGPLFIFLLIIVIVSIFECKENYNKDLERLDKCIEVANEAGLDPNDEARSVFIEDCYKNN